MTTHRKQLECLYAWFVFYKDNNRFEDLEKTRKQIDAFKRKAR